jgi:hypothetical protein
MMTAAEMENALCSVKRPRGQLKTRGLHLYDLMKPSALLPISIKGYGGSVSQFPFVLGLAMRLHGDGAKAVGKKLNLPWEPFQNIVRDLGMKPLTNKESRNRPTLLPDDKAQRLYEEAAMKSIGETRKDMTWSRHPAYLAWYSMQRYYADPESHNERCENWRKENKDKYLKRRKRWKVGYFKNNPSAKMADTLRSRLSSALKNHKQGRKVSAVKNLGCSLDFLVEYIESQFKSRMSWSNHGSVWHVDHIRPMASFDLTNKADQIAACHYTNLQPMYAKHNLKKSDSWDGQYEFAYELL